MPYISASIVFQLAGPVFPVIEKMQRDEEGRKTLTQWTRYLTVALCLFQSYGFAIFTEQLPGAVAHAGWGFRFTTRSEEHTSELQSRLHLVCRLLLEKKKK